MILAIPFKTRDDIQLPNREAVPMKIGKPDSITADTNMDATKPIAPKPRMILPAKSKNPDNWFSFSVDDKFLSSSKRLSSPELSVILLILCLRVL